MRHKESAQAHLYLDGKTGIEIGGSAHNPFNIMHCKNVDYTDDLCTIFKKQEIKLCGEALKVDIIADGGNLPFAENSLDFILSSHVLEHFKDPIGVLEHWMTIIKPSGYIFAIIPHKDRTFDKGRPCTILEELIERHKNSSLTPDTHEHYSVWRTEDFLKLCRYMNLPVIFWQDKDDKVGNGFTVVVQKQATGV